MDAVAVCNGLYGVNHFPIPGVLIAQGSKTVTINRLPAARVADKLACGADITHGNTGVYIGGPTATVCMIWDAEGLLKTGLEVLGFASFIVAGAAIAWAAGAAALAAGLGWTAAVAEFSGAGIAYLAVTKIAGAALNGLRQWGDQLGPGWGDIFESTGGLLMLWGGTTKAGGAALETAFNRLNPANYSVDETAFGSNFGNVKYVGSFSRRAQTSGDITLPNREQALREALERHGSADTSLYQTSDVYGKNDNLKGPNGEPYETVTSLDKDGNIIEIDHHKWGHQFPDGTHEYPHYHGPDGEHISYPPEQE